jgi:hypothetical protein
MVLDFFSPIGLNIDNRNDHLKSADRVESPFFSGQSAELAPAIEFLKRHYTLDR